MDHNQNLEKSHKHTKQPEWSPKRKNLNPSDVETPGPLKVTTKLGRDTKNDNLFILVLKTMSEDEQLSVVSGMSFTEKVEILKKLVAGMSVSTPIVDSKDKQQEVPLSPAITDTESTNSDFAWSVGSSTPVSTYSPSISSRKEPSRKEPSRKKSSTKSVISTPLDPSTGESPLNNLPPSPFTISNTMSFKYPQIAQEVKQKLEICYRIPVRYAVVKTLTYRDYLESVESNCWLVRYDSNMRKCGCTEDNHKQIVEELRDWVWVTSTNLARRQVGVLD